MEIATSKVKFNFYNAQRVKNISTQRQTKELKTTEPALKKIYKGNLTLRWSNDSHNHENIGGGGNEFPMSIRRTKEYWE